MPPRASALRTTSVPVTVFLLALGALQASRASGQMSCSSAGAIVQQPVVSNIDTIILANPYPDSLPNGIFVLRTDWQGSKTNQAPVLWNVDELTGFKPTGTPGLFQRGTQPAKPRSALQAESGTIGIWLNSMDLGNGAAPNNGSLATHAVCWWTSDSAQQPWGGYTELAAAFDLQVPYASAIGGAAAFVKLNLILESQGRQFFLGIGVFDLRPEMATQVEIHADASGTTSLVIADAALGTNNGWFTATSNSARFATSAFTGWRHFEIRMSRTGLQSLLAAIRLQPGFQDMPTDPATYRLVHFNLGPEVYDPDASSHGQLGLSFRNLKIWASTTLRR